MTHWRHNGGVTLVEMLVVLGIILVLAGISALVLPRLDNQSRENAVRNTVAVVSSALREYYEFKGEFPAQSERNAAHAQAHVELMLQALQAVPASRRMLDKVSDTLLKSDNQNAPGQNAPAVFLCDPWGTALDYVCAPEDTFPELISAGPDKVFGTGDDISNKGKP